MYRPTNFPSALKLAGQLVRQIALSMCVLALLVYGLTERAYAQDTTDHILEPGESISGVDSITSQNGLYTLDVHPINGDVFVNGPSGMGWMLSVGIEDPDYDFANMILQMQTDGNFTVSAPFYFDWDTGTASAENAGASLHLK